MDTIQALKVLGRFRETWKTVAKGVVLDGEIHGVNQPIEFGSYLNFEVAHHQVSLFVSVGPRFGITERCIILDTRTKAADEEHLILSNIFNYGTDKTLLELSEELQSLKKAKDRKALEEAIKTWLASEHAQIIATPGEFDRRVKILLLNTVGRMNWMGVHPRISPNGTTRVS